MNRVPHGFLNSHFKKSTSGILKGLDRVAEAPVYVEAVGVVGSH